MPGHTDFNRRPVRFPPLNLQHKVGRERQGAIDDINAGNEALDQAYKDFGEGKVDMAQSQLDKANEDFARAASKLQ